MHSSKRNYVTRALGLAVLCAVVFVAGCTVSNQEAPSLAGPSGFSQSLTVTAAPQVLPRDGNSMSTIAVSALNADGTPKPNLRLSLHTDFGTLSASDVTTGSNGVATVTFVSPGINESVDVVTIVATPVETGDYANNTWNQGSVRIRVMGPSIPKAEFTEDSPKAVLAFVTFNASATTLGTDPCMSACAYSWTFGDGSTGRDLVVQHQYSSPGVFNVTLTVTSPSGTSNSVTKPVVITLPGVTTPVFSASNCLSGAANCKTMTDNSAPNDGVTIVSRLWDFGDGTSPVASTDPIIDHTFPPNPSQVSYNVRLRLTDNFGRVSSATQQVQVP